MKDWLYQAVDALLQRRHASLTIKKSEGVVSIDDTAKSRKYLSTN